MDVFLGVTIQLTADPMRFVSVNLLTFTWAKSSHLDVADTYFQV